MTLPLWELLSGSLFIVILAYAAIRAHAIDLSGSVAGAIITFIVFIAGGARWLAIIVAFFIISSALTRVGYEYKKRLGSAQEKGGRRSWPNTVANGGVAAILALAEIYSHQQLLVVAFLSSIAAALADTVATEVGLLSKSKPRLITRLSRIIEPGTSGGVTGLGELVAFGSALGISALGVLLSIIGRSGQLSALAAMVSVVTGAFLGTAIDSFLGATVQGMRRCEICGSLTENRYHHGEEAKIVKGSRYIDNNVVNFVGILAGALLSAALYSVLV
ncbi:MAG: DUF92 domain-containing protein [Nitrososphaerales archaeon]